ncbi:hypothetical protein KQI22_11070 [Kineothrix sp. MSJ-39]|uniref:fibronectin type III domain-containing protein n=1 Tax=Kineothrix sp. MSJ-39 TaxID=2841533 RepID=UPI001C0FDF9C|nr:hypothetical protein [Kineothrix sp. MSJ-39]MBU5430597.1 hypothetical protein [Kineothrix sp. MSJ-39]
MKKRLLCALLAAAMCFGETLSASAVTVSTNDVEMEQAGTISENSTEVDAEKEKVTPNIIVDEYPAETIPVGKNSEVTIRVSVDTEYYVCVYNAEGKDMGIGAKNRRSSTTPTEGSSYVKIKVPLQLDDLPVGTYTLKWGVEDTERGSYDFKILKSLDAKDNKNIIKTDVSNVVYDGKTAKPNITIVESIGDNSYTLVYKKDFDYKLTTDNQKNMGTVGIEIWGIGDYTGIITKTFDITPQAPAITGAVCTGFNSAKITWNAVANANGYILERKTGNGNFAQIATLASGVTSYEDTTGLVTGETYYYRIVAKADSKTNANQYVESERNATGVAVKITPSSPKLISLESTSYNKLKLTWNTVNGATGYLVYQILADGSYKQVKTVAQPATGTQASATMTKLKAGQKYRYTVKAYTLAANSVAKIVSGCDTTGLSAKAKPATPVVTSVKATDYNKITIKWKKVTKAYGYYIYRKVADDEDAAWKRIKKVKYGSTTSYVDSKAETGVKYIYTVKAYTKVNGKNVFSAMNKSAKGAKVVRAVPKKPVIKLTQWGASIDVDINKVAGADGYVIYRKEGNGKYKKIATVDVKKNADFTTYKDATISSAKTYSYYVKAYKQTDESRVMSAKSKAIALTTR